MKKSHRILFVVALVAVVVIAIFVLWPLRDVPTPAAAIPAPPTEKPADVIANKPPQTAALLARIARNPQIADAAPLPVRLGTQPGGAIRFLGIERGWRLPAAESRVAGKPAETARNFLLAHREAFGLANPRFDLTTFTTLPNKARTSVRLQQTYGKLPVLAAETVVQVMDSGDITSVLADFATEVAGLDALPLPLVPKLSAPDAARRAVQIVSGEMRRGLVKPETPQLIVYAPGVLGLPGTPALAWEVRVASPGEPARARGRAIIHAGDGSLLNYLDQICSGTDRFMYDDNNSATTHPQLLADGSTAVRTEGGPPTGVAEVDNLYDFLGQTHAFYFLHHQRDSYDNAGGRIYAIARAVPPGQTAPWTNASASGNVIQAGVGFVVDDVTAHEFTHLVTENTSRLIYQNASGAINEAFSDIWGEFLDLFNTNLSPPTSDTAANRWLVGEELSGGAIRDMKNPLTRGDPDLLGSAFLIPVAVVPDGSDTGNDNGGVHTNSGIVNKLCYLLTDGDTFNGQTVSAEGINNVLQLFYEVQTAQLVPAADWRDLYFAITSAAANLEWSAPRQINVNRACSAVEISGASHDYFVDRSSPATAGAPPQAVQEVGIPNVVGTLGPFRSIQAGINAVNDGGTLRIKGDAGTYNMGGVFNFTKPMTLQPYNAPATIAP